jgi:hypothetical protein
MSGLSAGSTLTCTHQDCDCRVGVAKLFRRDGRDHESVYRCMRLRSRARLNEIQLKFDLRDSPLQRVT